MCTMETFLTTTILSGFEEEMKSLMWNTQFKLESTLHICYYSCNGKKDQNRYWVSSTSALMACFPEHYGLIFSCSIHLDSNNYCAAGPHCSSTQKALAPTLFTLLICLVNLFQSSSSRGELGSSHSRGPASRKRSCKANRLQVAQEVDSSDRAESDQVCVFRIHPSSKPTNKWTKTKNTDYFFCLFVCFVIACFIALGICKLRHALVS